eukprot:m.208748 g.208748  ORF g.208748 m.208748 type:complete len:89 (-) comp22081_c7_seq3:30-296(-)
MTTRRYTLADLKGTEWPFELDIVLFNQISEYKPIGPHCHLRILPVFRALRRRVPDITVAAVWERLAVFYDLEALVSVSRMRVGQKGFK